MLKWSFLFLVIAIVAGMLGFTGVASTSVGIAKVLFFISITLFVVLLVAGASIAGRISGRSH